MTAARRFTGATVSGQMRTRLDSLPTTGRLEDEALRPAGHGLRPVIADVSFLPHEWPEVVDSASSLAPTERLLSRRNGCRTRRAQDREGSTAANELCPIERPETGRPEIEHRGFTTLRRSAADQFELRLLSQSHGLNPSVPRLGAIGDLCRTRHRWPGCVISRSGCRHVLSRNSQRGLCNDADPFALLASPQVPCQSSTPACCVPVIAICASI